MQNQQTVVKSIGTQRYQERHLETCQICPSSEYQTAQKILRRSGLNVNNWGFLLHDLASELRGEGPYILREQF